MISKVSSPGLGTRRASQIDCPLRRIGEAPAGGERARRVVERGRLHRVDLDAGTERAQRQAAAGDQAAAAAGDQGGVEAGALLLGLAGELEPGGALAGDDPRVVVRSDQRRPAALGDLRADRLARLARPVVEADLGAMAAGALDLDRRRVDRHDDGRGLAQEPRCSGHPLGVVAGRVGDHRIRVELTDRVVGAAKFERPGALQAFRLQQDAPADLLVQRLGFEQRGGCGDAAQSCGRSLDVGESGQAVDRFHEPLIAELADDANGG